MALPENTLSNTIHENAFVGARGASDSPYVDYEDGGIALSDPSEGHFYQWWRARIENDSILLDSKYNEEVVMHEGTGLTEVSLTFDQNMRPYIAYVEDGISYLIWFNPLISQQDTLVLGPSVKNPRITLDDKRTFQRSNSDVVLAYLRDDRLYLRYQRDRFTVEYDPTESLEAGARDRYRAMVKASAGLIKVGMGHNYRLLFKFKKPDPPLLQLSKIMPQCSSDGELIWP